MSLQEYVVLSTTGRQVPTIENLGAAMPADLGMSEGVRVERAELSARERSSLRRDPSVRAMAPPMPMRLIEPTDDPADAAADVSAAATWGVEAVGAVASTFDGSGITVAVLDTGIEPGHEAFASVDLLQKNFTDGSDDDVDGHGTHCAGTIFGQDVDGSRIGIARNIDRALIGKVLGDGGGSSASIASAVLWAVDEGANVVSMSLGIDFPGFVQRLVDRSGFDIPEATSMALEGYRANINLFTELAKFVQVRGAFGNGTIIVAAAGNESARNRYTIAVAPPAAGSGVISVGALGESDDGLQVAGFSNTQVDLSAPGVGVVSARLGGGLRAMSGTSMATPHVAGVAALWAQRQLERDGGIDADALTARLIASGTRVGLKSGTQEEDVGTGNVQAPA